MGGLTDVIETEIIPIVSKVAPLLGSILGTPLAGVALSLIGNAFNAHSVKADEIAKILSNDPEASLKLKTVEYENSQILAQIAATNYQTEVDDRKDARDKNSFLYKDFLRHMAYIITFGFFCVLFLLFIPLSINGTEREILLMLVGMLVSKWQTIIDFFYGSSRK